MSTNRKISPIYARYNGGMLGYFLSGAPAYYANSRYPVLRRRLNQFLEELDLLPILPKDRPKHSAEGQLIKEVIFMVRTVSEMTADFAYLSCLAFQYVIQRGVNLKIAYECRNIAKEWMDKYEISTERLDDFASSIVTGKDGWISADELHTAGLKFLKSLIEPLRTSKNTAFVAMPFARPFDKYYFSFYKPLLARLNLNAIRAWGGLSHENYQEIIAILIRKCGVVLADLTTLNINVIHEIGMAESMDKTLFLIAAKDEVIPPSNLADLAIIQYDRSGTDWERREIENCAAIISLEKAGLEFMANN